MQQAVGFHIIFISLYYIRMNKTTCNSVKSNAVSDVRRGRGRLTFYPGGGFCVFIHSLCSTCWTNSTKF
jgi:hypothetical protein